AWEGRRTSQAKRWVEAGITAARAANATDRLARLLSLGATIANLGGEHERARAYSQEAAILRPTAEPDEDPVAPGGRIVTALTGDLRAAGPAELRFTHEYEVIANAFEPLLTWDSRGAMVPLLAVAWETYESGREFVFTLRDGVWMHDGSEMAADSVKFSFERAARESGRSLPAAIAAIKGVDAFVEGTADDIAGVDAISRYELRIRLTEPLPIYPALLTDPRTSIATNAVDGLALTAGTGPFVIRSIEQHSALLERNESYWGDAPLVDAIEFRVVPRSSDRAAGVRSGEYDLVGGLEPDDLDALLQTRPVRTSFVEAPIKSTNFLLFNASSAVAKAPGFARALTGVVRVHDLVRGTLGRFAQPAEGLLPPGILGHDPGRRRATLAVADAAQILAYAGLGKQVRLRASISPSVQSRYGPMLDALFAEWAPLGIEVSVETSTLADHVRSFEEATDLDFTLQEWEADYDDPDTFTYALFHSQGGYFARYYSSPELDQLIDQARAEPRAVTREGIYRRIEEHLLDTGLFLPLFHRVDYRVASASVRRLSLESAPPFVGYSRIGKTAAATSSTARPGRVTLHIPLPSDFDSIDPREVTSVAAIEPSLAVFETLVRPNAEAHVVPWLASDFRLEDRGRRYAFRLRDDVRFHDGRRLTARDVRFSFERLLRSKGDYDQLLFPVKGAELYAAGRAAELEGFHIRSASEFEIELERPLSILPALLTCGAAAIVPEGTTRASGTWQSGCVGTGPFRVAYAGSSGRLELEANPYYWRRGYPRSERLAFTAENDSSARAAAFREGRYSVGWLLARADEDALLHEPEIAARGLRVPEIATTMLVLNAKKGPLADELTRRRFASALEVEAFVRRVEGPGAVTAHSLIPPGLLGHDPQTAAEVQTLFEEASAPVKLTVSLTPPLRTAWGSEFVRWLADRGFKARIVTETYAEHEEAVGAGAVDVAATGWNFDYPDADSIVYGALHSSGRFGREFVASAEIDRLADLGRTETDPEARRAIYREVEQIVARRAHAIPLYYQRRWFFPGPAVDGVELNLFQPYLSYEKLFVRE
ncbi:MAG TPA: ABC transporter substrate-binding protein, partial [Blastocatellia bacterium]|nr:ABC transporter substrate-binding protein [Blastocatellia bacterium]